MIKKFVYYGLALIIIAIVIALISGYLLNNKVSRSISSTNITVGSGGFADVAIPGGNYTALAIYAMVSNNTNIYVLNGSAFSGWSNRLSLNESAGGLSVVQALGVNSSYVFKDKRTVYTQLFTQPGNGPNSSMSGVYVVIDNTPGSNSTKVPVSGAVTYIPLQLSSLMVYEVPVIMSLIIGAVGIILIIYGLVKRGGQGGVNAVQTEGGATKEQRDKEYLEQIYKGVGSDKKKRRKKDKKQ